ncbi:hypothetical protein [Microvirga sp. M2]|uniref:hypothetical protein n=1 Tax=Microvirga sp. M2 TaxID=3073270 RepID=UPI0039C082D5
MTSAHKTATALAGAQERAYNLFRNREFPEIICAVPEVCPVPDFIQPDQWEFERPLRPAEPHPPGFQDKAADTAVRFNGFYLFYALASVPAVQAALDMMMGGL